MLLATRWQSEEKDGLDEQTHELGSLAADVPKYVSHQQVQFHFTLQRICIVGCVLELRSVTCRLCNLLEVSLLQ
eukprot:COSAG02_NODE_3442_length_6731_cov_1.831273_3_plen_74_part_00